MRLSELCIRRPVMTTLVMASLLLAGFFGYRQLPIAAIPRIEVPTISVSVQYPGYWRIPWRSRFAAPLERQFSTIAGVGAITSLNTEGSSQITPEFDLNRSIDAAALDVQSAISVAASRLPEDLPTPPAYRKVNFADAPVIFPGADLRDGPVAGDERVRRQGDEPAPVDAAGGRAGEHPGRSEARRERYDLDALATRGISVEEIRQAVAAQSTGRPLAASAHSAALYPGGEGRRADRGLLQADRRCLAQWRAGVRIQDIAKVEDSVENEEARAEFSAMRSIIVSVQRQPDANTVAVCDGIRNAPAAVPAGLPPTIKLNVLSDRSGRSAPRCTMCRSRAMLTAVLVILVILAFLRTLARHIHPGHRPAAVDHRHRSPAWRCSTSRSTTSACWRSPWRSASSSTMPSSCSRTSSATSSKA